MSSSETKCNEPHFNLTLSSDPDFESIANLLRPFRLDFTSPSTTVSKLSGGTSNALFRVSNDGASVVVRVNGEDAVVDRQREILDRRRLVRHGMTPPFLATFDNGVVYDFVEGRTLKREDLRDGMIAGLVAFQMSKLHSIRPRKSEKVESVLWRWMEDFVSLIPSTGPVSNVIPSRETLRAEVESLRRRAESFTSSSSSLVFCHNDISCDNSIFDEKLAQVRFIDWEFGGWNRAAFDVANHFTEFVGGWSDEGEGEGFQIDFSLCPNKKEKTQWIRFYLRCCSFMNSFKSTVDDELSRQPVFDIAAISAQRISEEEVEAFLKEVNVMEEASHLFWSLWALNQARVSSIGVSFGRYADLRYEQSKKIGAISD